MIQWPRNVGGDSNRRDDDSTQRLLTLTTPMQLHHTLLLHLHEGQRLIDQAGSILSRARDRDRVSKSSGRRSSVRRAATVWRIGSCNLLILPWHMSQVFGNQPLPGTRSMSSTPIPQTPPSIAGTRAVRDAVAGTLAGIFARTAVAPVDRVKLILQVRGSIVPCCGTCQPSKVLQSRKAWNVFWAIIREEGFTSLWRGSVPIVLIQAGTSALNFMFMEQYKLLAASSIAHLSERYPAMREEGGRSQRFVSSFLSGGLAGATTITFLYPLGFLRTRLAADVGNASKQERVYPNGMRDVTKSIWRSDGFKGFYKGYGIALASVTVYRVVYLGGYDFLKSEMHVNNGDGAVPQTATIGQKFLAAQIVSMAASISYYPLDSVRRRMMMEAGKVDHQRMYRNSMHCFQRILKEEGVRGFHLGIGADLARSVGAALVLVSYDEIKRLMHE